MAVRTPRPVVLEAEDVSISKTFVTLKVIQVNNRQMTQSVFKQLPTIPLFDHRTLQLSGVIWGWVNYGLSHYRNQNFIVQQGQLIFRSQFFVESFDKVHEYARYFSIPREHDPCVPYDIHRFLHTAKGPWEAYGARWDALMDELRAAEQLFIAA